ncbi:MAG: LysM peptidoglycan-binding domain-containing protein [Anaerolineae bacterium]
MRRFSPFLFLVLIVSLSACQSAAPPAPTIGTPAAAAALAPTPLPDAKGASSSPAALATPNPPRPAGPPSTPIGVRPTWTPRADRPTFDTYTIKSGDTLSGIADRLDVPMSALISANGITDPGKIRIGQVLKIPAQVDTSAPTDPLIPDSELVYGPSARDFDVARFAASQPGYLKSHTEIVEGRKLTGPEIIQLVATRYSVNPRLLLTLLEMNGGWLSNPAPEGNAKTYPMGRIEGGRPSLYLQSTWTANALNQGYYGWKSRDLSSLTYKDGRRAKLNPALNPGSLAVQYMLAAINTSDAFAQAVAKDGAFRQTYQRLFGDPYARAVDPVVPPDLQQPEMKLPWTAGEWWYYTGGPHGAWASGSAWGALDFIPGRDTMGGCWDASKYWDTAVAPGLVVRSENGEVAVNLQGENTETTGWVVFYMHVADDDRVPVGTQLKQGERIGHPSCEGGASNGTHLHIARKYNGEWLPAYGPIPFVLSGWTAQSQGVEEYDGTLVKGSDKRESCECRVDETNGLVSDNR